MTLKIEINLDNAAFGDSPGVEAGRILKELGEDMAEGRALLDVGDHENMIDFNGNKVGKAVCNTMKLTPPIRRYRIHQ